MYLTMTLSLRYFYRNFFRLWQLATIVGTSLTFCPTGYVNPVPDMPDI